MSRSGYVDDYDGEGWENALYRGRISSATRGKRGQTFFRDLVRALDAMPDRRLVDSELETDTGAVCALGALGQARGLDMKPLDPEDADSVAFAFNIAECLAREVVFANDECGSGDKAERPCRHCHGWGEVMSRWTMRPDRCWRCSGTGREVYWKDETPSARWQRMRDWAASQIRQERSA